MAVTRTPAILIVVAACTNNTTVVTPVIDEPTNVNASAFPLDSIAVSIAHAGAGLNNDLISVTFQRGEQVEVSNVPFGDDLVLHLIGRQGTSEVAYGRTCQFSIRPDGRVPTPHLYFSREVKFGGLSPLPLSREGATAITYTDGSGLLIGGTNPNEVTDAIEQVERFDPNTGEYETLHELAPRLGAAAALVGDPSNARVVVIGGLDPTTGLGATFMEVIDADRFTDLQYERIDDAQITRMGLTATTLTDGRVIAIGGRIPPNTVSKAVNQISVSSGRPEVSLTRAMLKYPLGNAGRYGHTATRLADDVGSPVLVAGGLDSTGRPIPEAELFKPLSDGFSEMFDATMIVPRSQHTAVRLPDGSVMIVGGVDEMNRPVSKIEVFSLDVGFVSDPTGASDMPPNAGLVGLTATTLPDGRVLLTGGSMTPGGPPVTNAFIARLDPFDGLVDIVATDRLAYARAGHQATVLCDGTVLISGGTADQTPYERYNPPSVGRR